MVHGLRTEDKIWEEEWHTRGCSLPWLYVELEQASQAERKVRTALDESGSVSQRVVPCREPWVSISVRSKVWAGCRHHTKLWGDVI